MDLMERFEFECFWEAMETFYGSQLEDRFCRLLWQFPCKKFSQFVVPTSANDVDSPFQPNEIQCEFRKRFGETSEFMETIERDYGPMTDSKLPAEFRDVYLSLGNKVADIELDDFEDALRNIKRAKTRLPGYQSLKLNIKKLSVHERKESDRFEYECFWETVKKYNDPLLEDKSEMFLLMWKFGFKTHGCLRLFSPENEAMHCESMAKSARYSRKLALLHDNSSIDEDSLYEKEFGMTIQEFSHYRNFNAQACDLCCKMMTVDITSFDKHLQCVRRKHRMKRTARKAIKTLAIVIISLLSAFYFLKL